MKLSLNTIRKRVPLALYGIIPLFLLFVFIAISLTRNTETQSNPSLAISTGSVTVGQRKDSLTTQITPSQAVSNEDSTEILYFDTDNQWRKDQVILENNKVKLIKKEVTSLELKTIRDFLPAPTTNPLIRIGAGSDAHAPLYVYSLDGYAFIAHVNDQRVYQIWRFEPMTPEQFLADLGKDLIDPSDFQLSE